MPNVTIYTKPACGPCVATKRAFKTSGVEFAEVRVDQDETARDRVIADGFLQSPVVYVDGLEPWAGFDPLRISDAVAHVRGD